MQPLELLRKIVSIDSIFPKESELALFLGEQLRAQGFSVQMQEFENKRYNVLATKAGIGRPILLYAHMDTVPAYGYDNTERDPFKMHEEGGKLFGLGVYDMKAGIASILKATENMKTDKTIKVMFVSDEEADSRGCYEVTKTNFLKDVDFCLSTEMSDVKDAGESARTITLGRRGRAQYELAVPGKSVHAARMKEGVSAITQGAKIAIEIEKMNAELPRHEKLSHGDQYVRYFSSKSVSLSVPDNAILLIDRHLIFPETIESARKQIEGKINELYEQKKVREIDGKRARLILKPRDVPYLLPYIIPETNEHVKKLSRAVVKTLDAEPRFNYGLTVADENMIAMQGIPTITYGPIGGGEHSNNEWVSKKSYLELIEVLTAFLNG
ncbi:M20/M25/M40 family metallo-hydrolase [Candidatus Micrarchaeota archaeon]|nr:M20/M25/M40 family metallo-hydrolase [Candidatus Micrarchaeota archaeon]